MLRSWAHLCRAPISACVRPCAFTRLSRASALGCAARPHHCRSSPPLAPPLGPRSAYCSRSGPPSLASARSSACVLARPAPLAPWTHAGPLHARCASAPRAGARCCLSRSPPAAALPPAVLLRAPEPLGTASRPLPRA
ncbi:hypothetical protein PAHAL_4G236500 [Panicum hallii]|uniref:Uncharacterized protein n=1 Tax=Panicum hallii TaxID=206008 RepID=A0A2T8JDS2_9POAL|nr:hypothetical protein PAHAL_4G236500 [Panicum hallii]